MMAESMDSRKFERKPLFDVPLPMRRAPREVSLLGDESPPEAVVAPVMPSSTMIFSLMTKKGNKQQVRCYNQSLPNAR